MTTLDHCPCAPARDGFVGPLAWRATHAFARPFQASVLVMVVRFGDDHAVGCTHEEFRGRKTWRPPYQMQVRPYGAARVVDVHDPALGGPLVPFGVGAVAAGEAAAEIVFDENAGAARPWTPEPSVWNVADAGAFLRDAGDAPGFPATAADLAAATDLTTRGPSEWFNTFIVAARERYAAMHEAAHAARSRR